MAALSVADEDEEKRHQSRGTSLTSYHNLHLSVGGKALKRDVSGQADKEAAKRAKAKILIHITERNRRKAITYIKGLEVFGTQLNSCKCILIQCS